MDMMDCPLHPELRFASQKIEWPRLAKSKATVTLFGWNKQFVGHRQQRKEGSCRAIYFMNGRSIEKDDRLAIHCGISF
jgi:hypothetical protein